MEDDHILLSFFGINELDYSKFEIKVLNNLRQNVGFWNDVCPHNFVLKWNIKSFQTWSVRNS